MNIVFTKLIDYHLCPGPIESSLASSWLYPLPLVIHTITKPKTSDSRVLIVDVFDSFVFFIHEVKSIDDRDHIKEVMSIPLAISQRDGQ